MTRRWFAATQIVVLLMGVGGCAKGSMHADDAAFSGVSLRLSATPVPTASRPASTPEFSPLSAADNGAETPPATVPPRLAPVPSTTKPIQALPDDEAREFEQAVNLFAIPLLDESYRAAGEAQGAPFERTGPMPQGIVASTNECEILTVDATSGEVSVLWTYHGSETQYFHCDLTAEEALPPNYESSPYAISELEWVPSRYVVIGICCEPADGSFDLIDLAGNSRPYRLALRGGSASVGVEHVLVSGISLSFGQGGFDSLVLLPFEVQLDGSDPKRSTYLLAFDRSYYRFALAAEQASDADASVWDVTWVGHNRIAFELLVLRVFDQAHSLIGTIDVESRALALNSSARGWAMPAGDALGNLVVKEGGCRFRWVIHCETPYSSVVVVDADTLMPLHEVGFEEDIVDMDLSRGWLLVTFRDGRMGTVDLADGTFTLIAEGIVHAVWME